MTSVDSPANAELLNDRYEVLSILGEGATGRTLRARDHRRGASVAIKELLPSRLKNWKDFELFEREARLLERLEHRGVVAYRDHFEIVEEHNPRLFLVQELIDGGTLEEELIAKGVYTEVQAHDLAREVLDTLIYLHERPEPVLHRDIKPSNLMRRTDGSVVLIDFGAVHEVLDASAEGGGSTMVGTFGYMPPEQYAGEAYPETDLFGLGATLVHLLTGRSPETLFSALFTIRLPDDLVLSPGFEQWLRRMIDPDRTARFRTAREARAVLEAGMLMEALARPEALSLIPPSPGEPPRREVGFLLRDPSTGISLALRVGVQVGLIALSSTVLIDALLQPNAAMIVLGSFFPVFTLGMSTRVFVAWHRARMLYREGEWTMGEVTGTYADGGITYRYLVGTRIQHGSLVTRAKALLSLRTGDPVGVIYDATSPSTSMLFWA